MESPKLPKVHPVQKEDPLKKLRTGEKAGKIHPEDFWSQLPIKLVKRPDFVPHL